MYLVRARLGAARRCSSERPETEEMVRTHGVRKKGSAYAFFTRAMPHFGQLPGLVLALPSHFMGHS